jgi:hypothetical protein
MDIETNVGGVAIESTQLLGLSKDYGVCTNCKKKASCNHSAMVTGFVSKSCFWFLRYNSVKPNAGSHRQEKAGS